MGERKKSLQLKVDCAMILNDTLNGGVVCSLKK